MGNQFKSVAAIACMKSFLMIFNIILWINGMVMLAIGLWSQVELYKYLELSTDLSDTIPYVIIGIGILIVFVTSLACTCTLKGQPVLLYLYGGFLGIILILQIGLEFSIHTYKAKLAEGFDRGLNQSFLNNHAGHGDNSADFDFMQSTLHCCGIHNYTDWMNLVPQRAIPMSCCKLEIDNCITANTGDIYTQGCYVTIVSFINNNLNWIMTAAIGMSLFPFIGMVLSCCLANQVKKAKYDVMS